jgi:hypothetical protein
VSGSNLCTNCKQPKSKWLLQGCFVLPSGECVPYQYCSVACMRVARQKQDGEKAVAA